MALTTTGPATHFGVRRPQRFKIQTDLVGDDTADIVSCQINGGSTNTFYFDKATYPNFDTDFPPDTVVLGSGFEGNTASANSRWRIISVTDTGTQWEVVGSQTLEGSSTYTGTVGTITKDNDVRVKTEVMLNGTVIASFWNRFMGTNTVYFYVNKIIQDLLSYDTGINLTDYDVSNGLGKLYSRLNLTFYEYLGDENGDLSLTDTKHSTTHFVFDAERSAELSNLDDYIVGIGFKFLTHRSKLFVGNDVQTISFISTVNGKVRLYANDSSGDTLVDERDFTAGYNTYSFFGVQSGENHRKIMLIDTLGEILSETKYVYPHTRCFNARVMYRNRLGGYDWAYIEYEMKSEAKRTLYEIDTGTSFDYENDRMLNQTGLERTDGGVLYTETLSDLYASELLDSPDVYLVIGTNRYPIIVTNSSIDVKKHKLSSLKINFKFSNYGNTEIK